MATRLTNLCTREADVQRQAMRLCGKTVGRDFRLIFPPAASLKKLLRQPTFFLEQIKYTTMARRTKTLAEQLAELDNPAPKGMRTLYNYNQQLLTKTRRL